MKITDHARQRLKERSVIAPESYLLAAKFAHKLGSGRKIRRSRHRRATFYSDYLELRWVFTWSGDTLITVVNKTR
jgi:hypothetical protein